jgi:hypothetical protein
VTQFANGEAMPKSMTEILHEIVVVEDLINQSEDDWLDTNLAALERSLSRAEIVTGQDAEELLTYLRPDRRARGQSPGVG